MPSVKIDIITCSEWGARHPKHPISTVGKALRVIFHHTAGHHAEILNPRNESREEAIRYARDIQQFHMRQGWIDSGHNFLVCRNGLILQGRWKTVSAIESGYMVQSAHTLGDNGRPSQNDQIGIEHEHVGDESMTTAQREASARLMAWIADQYGRELTVLPVFPHRKFTSTSCPANLASEIPLIRKMANEILVRGRK